MLVLDATDVPARQKVRRRAPTTSTRASTGSALAREMMPRLVLAQSKVSCRPAPSETMIRKVTSSLPSVNVRTITALIRPEICTLFVSAVELSSFDFRPEVAMRACEEVMLPASWMRDQPVVTQVEFVDGARVRAHLGMSLKGLDDFRAQRSSASIQLFKALPCVGQLILINSNDLQEPLSGLSLSPECFQAICVGILQTCSPLRC